MTRKERILWPLADGVWTGLCLLLGVNIMLTKNFPVDLLPLLLLVAAAFLGSSILAWIVLPRYTGLGQRALHLLASIPGFLLVMALEAINLDTLRWWPIPIRELSYGDGLLLLMYLCLIPCVTAVIRLILIFVRRNKA